MSGKVRLIPTSFLHKVMLSVGLLSAPMSRSYKGRDSMC